MSEVVRTFGRNGRVALAYLNQSQMLAERLHNVLATGSPVGRVRGNVS